MVFVKDFLIVKVNGRDLSQASHEAAVEAFRTAEEPIIVEVLRRGSTANKNATQCGHSDLGSDRANADKSRRERNNNTSNSASESDETMKSRPLVSTATQTDDYIENQSYCGIRGGRGAPSPPPPPPPRCLKGLLNTSGLYQPSSRQPVAFPPTADLGLTDIEMADGCDFQDHYDDDDFPYEMEYEDVVLHRGTSEEKIGLTLCYGSVDEEDTDIFISEIEPYSIAAQDGRIREGDQILRINSVDVHSRDEAIRSFSKSLSDIHLLLARPQHVQMDDGFLDGHSYLDELHTEMLEDRDGALGGGFRTTLLSQIDEEGGTTDTATTENSQKHDKDSGVGRTDESTRNDESSEHEILDGECLTPTSMSRLRSGDLHFSNDSFASNEATEPDFLADNEISTADCDKFRAALETRCPRTEEVAGGALTGQHSSVVSIDCELEQLNREMENISVECQEIVEAHLRKQRATNEMTRSPRLVPRMGTRIDYSKLPSTPSPSDNNNETDSKSETITPTSPTDAKTRFPSPTDPQTRPRDSSESKPITPDTLDRSDTSNTSAYNTADSSRSKASSGVAAQPPVTLELSTEGQHRGSVLSLAATSTAYPSDSDKTTQTRRERRRDDNKRSSRSGRSSQSSETTPDSPATIMADEVMYTNEANLQHTMAIQQKLFEQRLNQRGRAGTVGSTPSGTVGSTQSIDMTEYNDTSHSTNRSARKPPGKVTPGETEMEWVVKKRADGSRYITRRPVRAKLMKERAKKLSEERMGLTTDDEAMSELKVGRYWSKEDRKRHMENAKDHRRRKEFMMRARMETLKEQNEVNIVDLSHRKMSKYKGKRALDSFTTVQEIFAHGSKSSDVKHPLLSVTTV